MPTTESEQMLGALLAPEIAELIDKRQTTEVRAALATLQDPELADLLASLEGGHGMIAFRFLSRDRQTAVFSLMKPAEQERLLSDLSNEHLAQLLDDMAPDDRATLFEELPGEVTAKLLALLHPFERKRTQFLLGYPAKSVGRIMTPDYIALRPEWTLQQCIDHIRKYGKDAETLSMVYVIDEKGKLLDDIRLRSVLLNDPATTVRSIMDNSFTALRATDEREEAVRAMKRYDRPALPVVNTDGILVGIVTFDDVADVAEKEATEDIHKMGGLEALDEPYMATSFLRLVRHRGIWLSVLFVGELFTASAMGAYDDEIKKATVLALFLPLIISSGGNSGSQACTLVIRAMALREIRVRDWFKVLRRELACGILLGVLLGLLGLGRIHLWQWLHWFDYSQGGTFSPHAVAFAVALSLVGVVLWGTLMGGLLPILLRKLKLDPAAISAPLIATLVDVSGLLIYFNVAILILRPVH